VTIVVLAFIWCPPMPGGSRIQLKPQAISLIAAGERYDRTAEQLGLHERTVRRWAADEEFAAEVRVIRGQALADAAAHLSDGLTAAATTMVELLGDDDPKIRLAAAREVVNTFCRIRDAHLLEARVASLEARAAVLTPSDRESHENREADQCD
jgi:hypothetical protein